MSIAASIERAKKGERKTSKSEHAWRALSEADRTAVTETLVSKDIGVGKMHKILEENGARISVYWLEQVRDGKAK